MLGKALTVGLLLWSGTAQLYAADPQPDAADYTAVRLQSFVKIPLRDGVRLSADVYLPESTVAPRACVLTMTPYISQSYHDRGVYFAAHNYALISVDVRGRGDSEGE